MEKRVPSVQRPPMGNRPKRRNGTEKVTTLGVMSRMTITSSGFGGMSFDDMMPRVLLSLNDDATDTEAAAADRTRAPARTLFLAAGVRRCETDDVPDDLALRGSQSELGTGRIRTLRIIITRTER